MMDDPQSKRRILAWLHGCPCKALSRRREQMVGSLRSAIRAPRIVQAPVSWLCQPIRGSDNYPEHLVSRVVSAEFSVAREVKFHPRQLGKDGVRNNLADAVRKSRTDITVTAHPFTAARARIASFESVDVVFKIEKCSRS
jgi:hypothetical protein